MKKKNQKMKRIFTNQVAEAKVEIAKLYVKKSTKSKVKKIMNV